MAESKWECVRGAPTAALAPFNKGEKPGPSPRTCVAKDKAKTSTYHCCSKSQSLKKSNRSIAAGRRRRTGVRPCSRRPGSPALPDRLKVPGPHRPRRRAPKMLGPALWSCGGDGTGRASAWKLARVRLVRGCPCTQRPVAEAAAAADSGRRSRPPGGLRAGGGGGGGVSRGRGSGAAQQPGRRRRWQR